MNDFVVIMNCLVSSPKDVDLLVKHGIVVGNNIEVSSFINKLADGVIMKPTDIYIFCSSLGRTQRLLQISLEYMESKPETKLFP